MAIMDGHQSQLANRQKWRILAFGGQNPVLLDDEKEGPKASIF